MRSMARWVLPVLVGPSTAVTLLARAAGGSERIGSKAQEPIFSPAHAGGSVDRVYAGLAADHARTSLERSGAESLTPAESGFVPFSESVPRRHEPCRHRALPDWRGEAALKAASVDYRAFVYDGVEHAFNNDTNAARYNEAAAKLAWERTVEFFRATLGGAA